MQKEIRHKIMKQIILYFTCTLLVLSAKAQVFSGSGGAINNNGTETYFNLPVSGLPGNIDSLYGLEEVCIDITHAKDEELYIYLVSPSGHTVELSEGSSCPGANYSGTCFNSNTALPITSAAAPYSGNFHPIGYLGRFNTGQPGNGVWTLIVKDYLAFDDSGVLNSWTLRFGNAPSKPVVFTSSNLPIVVINTNNQPITDAKTVMNFGIIYNGVGQLNHPTDAMNNYNGKAAIHIRGNTTKNFEKKAYAVELRNATGGKLAAPILGMPSESDWELLAEYQDKTLMRIPLTYQMTRRMGDYAARSKYVELIVDGEYRGVYALVEKLKIGPDRVNIRKLTNADNAMPYVSGGYLLQIDRPDYPGWNSLMPGNSPSNTNFYYQYSDPNDSNITSQQAAYIKQVMDDFETLMSSPNYADPSTGYRKSMDINSCVDFMIVNEISKNVDAYRLSAYLYKSEAASGGLLHAGPVWDYDLAWHNANYGDAPNVPGWEYLVQDATYPGPIWWRKFIGDTAFTNRLSCRWAALRKTVLSNNSLYYFIDSSAAVLNDAQKRNFTQWPILGTYIFPNPQNQVGATYASEIADLKTWISNRCAWLDINWPGPCRYDGINELANGLASIRIFPNPADGLATLRVNLPNPSSVALTLTDMTGCPVRSYPEEKKMEGDHEMNLDCSGLKPGVYFYQLSINDLIHSGKLIVE